MNLIRVVLKHPFGSAKTGVLQARIFRALLCSPLLWNSVGRASPPPAGIAPIGQPAGGFSIDGDLIANTPNANVGDWVSWTKAAGTGGPVLSANGTRLNPITTFHFVDPYNSSSDLTY